MAAAAPVAAPCAPSARRAARVSNLRSNPPLLAPAVCAPLAAHRRAVTVRYKGADGKEVAPSDVGAGAVGNEVKRRILMPLDFSKESELVAKWAVRHLYQEGDMFHLLHVVPMKQRATYYPDQAVMEVPAPKDLDEPVKASACFTLAHKFSALLNDYGVPFEVDCIEEEAPQHNVAPIGEMVCQAADRLDAAAVVMASHSRSPLAEFMLGSVSNYCTHHSEQPVLVLHNTEKERCITDDEECLTERNIVLAVDDSPLSEAACLWAIDNVHRPGDTFHLLHVVPAVPTAAAYHVGADGLMYYLTPTQLTFDENADDIKSMLGNNCIRHLEKAGVSYEIDLLSEFNVEGVSSVAEVICKKASDMDASLMIMGSHQKGPMAELMFGSVSNYCTHHAEVPVAVLHPHPAKPQPSTGLEN